MSHFSIFIVKASNQAYYLVRTSCHKKALALPISYRLKIKAIERFIHGVVVNGLTPIR